MNSNLREKIQPAGALETAYVVANEVAIRNMNEEGGNLVLHSVVSKRMVAAYKA